MSAFEEKELNQLADALASLTPRPAHLDRDGLLYEAGRRSARPSHFWPLATLTLGLIACGLTVALWFRPDPPVRWIHSVQPGADASQANASRVTAVDVGVPMPPAGNEANNAEASSAVRQLLQAGARQGSANQLKEIALAMHQFHGALGSLPPPANVGAQQKPLLSWRVHLLPYLQQDNLYKQFKLDEPWDSEHNKKLIPLMPKVYDSPLAKHVATGKTVYLAPAGPGMIFAGPQGMSFVKITDGTSNTILIVEANDAHAVTWTQPDDYKPEKQDPAAPLRRKDTNGFHVVLADASVRMIPNVVDGELLWALLTAAGGETIDQQKFGQE
jgi:Protein of unknown function (DUF1559)